MWAGRAVHKIECTRRLTTMRETGGQHEAIDCKYHAAPTSKPRGALFIPLVEIWDMPE